MIKSNWPYAAFVAGAIGFALALSSCAYCQTPATAQTLQCKALHEIEKCGPDALALVAYGLPFIVAQDWDGLFAMLRQQSPQAGACLIENWKANVAKRYGAGSIAYAQFLTHGQVYKASLRGH